MTSEKWIKLTDDEKRIKVAELTHPDFSRLFGAPVWWYTQEDDTSCDWVWKEENQNGLSITAHRVPDYLNDLNAMHKTEEEAFYADVLWHRRYARKVQEIVTRDFNAEGNGPTTTDPKEAGWFCWWLGTHATAAQRAEAFVLTMEPE